MPKGLMAAIAEDEAKLKELEAGDTGDDDAGGDEDDTQASKGKTNAGTDDADGDDEGDAAPGKKAEAKGKTDPKAVKDGADGDDADGDDADAGKKGKAEDENSLAAQLRIERKQRKQMEQRLEQLLAAQNNPTKQPAAQPKAEAGADGEGVKAKQPTAEERLERIEREQEQRQLEAAAVAEFNQHEAEFMRETPDYAQASDHMIKGMATAVRALYPNATDQQIGAFIRGQVLHIAAQAVQKGLNPAETLYKLSMERFGYAKGAPQPKTEDVTKRLEKSAATRKRTASPLAGGGQQASANATIEEAAKMSLADFAKLKPGELDQLMADAME